MKIAVAAGVLTALTVAGSVVSGRAQSVQQLHPNVRLFIPYQEYSQQDNQRVLELFDGLRVADVSDGMDMAGLTDVGTVDPEIRALWTDTQNFTHRIIGIAVTARYVPTNKRIAAIDRKTINQWYANITSEAFQQMLFPGAILVIDAAEDGESRSIGSTNIRDWQKRGMIGVVTSGGLADSDEIIYHKVPAYFRRFARGIRPGRNELESVNRPINVGGVLVRPGDVVLADGDGVIVVPREQAEEVAKFARTFLDNVGKERYEQRSKQKATAPDR
jgi:regulator of RNase E activity RraA